MSFFFLGELQTQSQCLQKNTITFLQKDDPILCLPKIKYIHFKFSYYPMGSLKTIVPSEYYNKEFLSSWCASSFASDIWHSCLFASLNYKCSWSQLLISVSFVVIFRSQGVLQIQGVLVNLEIYLDAPEFLLLLCRQSSQLFPHTRTFFTFHKTSDSNDAHIPLSFYFLCLKCGIDIAKIETVAYSRLKSSIIKSNLEYGVFNIFIVSNNHNVIYFIFLRFIHSLCIS